MTVRALTLSVRALREGTRTKAPYLLRGLLIVLMFLAVWSAHEASARANFGGILLLLWVGWADFVLILLLAVSAFSAVITEEKELMTLGLLRLAGFTPGSILLGKSVGLLVNALLLLVVQVPFCMLAVTLGGVTVEQVLAVFTLLLAFLVFAYGVAIFTSVISRRNSSAARLTGLLLLSYHVLPPFLVYLWAQLFGNSFLPTVPWLLGQASVTSAFHGLWSLTVSMGGFGMASFGAVSFGTHALVNAGAGVGLFLVSWLLFDPFNRSEVPSAPARALPWLKSADSRASHRCWTQALVWKDYRFLAGGRRKLVIRAVIYAVMIAIVLATASLNGGSGSWQDVGRFLCATMPMLVGIELGLAAGRVFQTEVKSKTLGALVALPKSLGSIVSAKVAGASMIAIPSAGFLLLGALLNPDEVGNFLAEVGDEPMAWFFGSQIVLCLFLTTYLSLRFMRGAFALGLATTALGNMVFWIGASLVLMGEVDIQVIGAVGFVLSIILCIVLGRKTVARLYRLASEE